MHNFAKGSSYSGFTRNVFAIKMLSSTHFRDKGSICITRNLRSRFIQGIYDTNQICPGPDIQGISRPIISKLDVILHKNNVLFE